MKSPKFADLKNLTEHERIDLMGIRIQNYGDTVGCIVEDKDKAARYIKKVMLRFPSVITIGQWPFATGILIKFGPKPKATAGQPPNPPSL